MCKFYSFIKKVFRMAEQFKVGEETFDLEDVAWISIGEYTRVEKSVDENGWEVTKSIQVILLVGSFGKREYAFIEPYLSQARALQSALRKLKPKY